MEVFFQLYQLNDVKMPLGLVNGFLEKIKIYIFKGQIIKYKIGEYSIELNKVSPSTLNLLFAALSFYVLPFNTKT